MSSPVADAADIIPNLPTALYNFKLNAMQTISGGCQQLIPLIKRPLLYAHESEESKRILTLWDNWWCNTTWGKDPTTNNPHWNSITRSGHVWTQFGEASHALTGHPHVYCLNCGSALQHPNVKSIGTKHLLNHVKSLACAQTRSPVHTQPTGRPQPQQRQGSIASPPYSIPAFESELVRLVIDNNWSFRTVERPSFQRFLRFLRPETVLTSRYKFGLLFQNQFKAAEASLLQDLGKDTKLSIALDAWTASNHLAFLAVKGYYINNNWQLRETLLDFIPMRGRHTGVSMAREVLHVLKATDTTKKLLAITCDNAGNNSTLSRSIQTNLQQEAYNWSSKENTIPCLAHIINLVVQDIIYHLKLSASPDAERGHTLQRQHVREIQTQMSVPNSLRKVYKCSSCLFITYIYHMLSSTQLRAICIAIDLSPQRFERFLATQRNLPANQRLSVIRDVKTRWNSTYDMCDRAVTLQSYIDEWLEQEIALKSTSPANNTSTSGDTVEADYKDLKKLRLAATEWQHLKAITQMLRRFKAATNFLSENQKPHIPYIWLMYNRLFDFLDQMTEELGEDSNNLENTEWPSVVRAAAEKGRSKLTKYYSRTGEEQGFLFNCATILDPTQKLTAYEVLLSQLFITAAR
jgi:hypothetical protein